MIEKLEIYSRVQAIMISTFLLPISYFLSESLRDSKVIPELKISSLGSRKKWKSYSLAQSSVVAAAAVTILSFWGCSFLSIALCVISFACVRFLCMGIILNEFLGLDQNFIGSTSVTDRIFAKITGYSSSSHIQTDETNSRIRAVYKAVLLIYIASLIVSIIYEIFIRK